MLGKLRKLRTLEDDEEVGAKGDSSTGTAQQPAWMRVLLSNCNEWLSALPSVRCLVLLPLKEYSYTLDCHTTSTPIVGKPRSSIQILRARGKSRHQASQPSTKGSEGSHSSMSRRDQANESSTKFNEPAGER